MAIGEVLPVPSQLIAESQQLRLLQLVYTCQDLTFGVSAFQRQAEVMQQSAEKAPIQQAEGFPGVGGPQLFRSAGDIVGQGLGAQFKAEQLRR